MAAPEGTIPAVRPRVCTKPVDLCDLGGFRGEKGRKEPREPFRQHRLTPSRRTDEQEMVIPRRRDLQDPLRRLLTPDLGEIELAGLHFLRSVLVPLARRLAGAACLLGR